MGLFSTDPSGRTSTTRRTSRYAAPNFAPPSRGQFSERSFPERIDISEQILQGIDLAVRAPAYSYERPIAAAAEFFGRDAQGKTIVDNISEGVRDIPVLGEHLDNAGKLTSAAFDETWKFTGAIQNAPYARLMEKYANAPDTQQIDPIDLMSLPPGLIDVILGAGIVPGAAQMSQTFSGGTTWGDLKKQLKKRGFTEEDIRALGAGEKGWLDFPEQSTSNREGVAGAVEDLGGRALLDPLNLVFGAGVISKGGKIIKGGVEVGEHINSAFFKPGRISQQVSKSRVPDRITALRLKNSADLATRNLTKHKPLGLTQGVAALAGGAWEGVTSASLSAFVHGWVRGSGAAFNSYRNLSLGTTGAQIGFNIMDEVIPDEWSSHIPGMEEFLGYWRRVGEHKPLSDNQLFQLAAIMRFPARDLLSAGYTKARAGKVRASRVDHQVKIFRELGGEGKVRNALRDSESVDALFAQILKLAIARRAWRRGEGANKALQKFYGSSLPELGLHFAEQNKRMARLMKEYLDEGHISGDEMVDAMRVMFAGRGDVLRDVTKGLDRQRFDPGQFLNTWNKWESLSRRLSDIYGDSNVLTIGIQDDVVLTSQIDNMLDMIDDAAAANRIRAEDLEEILMVAPAIFEFDQGAIFARTLTRSGQPQDIEKIKRRLREIRQEHAFEPDKYLADAIEWDATARRSADRTAKGNRKFNQDGTLAEDVNPEYGQAQLILPTQSFVRGTRAGSLAEPTATQIQSLRAREGVMAAEFNIPEALAEAGYGARSSIRVLSVDGNVTKTGIVMKVDDTKADLQSLSEMAALAARETGQGKATIVIRGEKALDVQGLQPNAAEFRWEPGRLDAETLDRTVKHLRKEFGDRVMVNDSTGTIRVLVRDTDTKYLSDLDRRLRAVDDIIGVEPSKQRAFVQDIVAKAKKTDDAGTRTFESVAKQITPAHRYRWELARERLQKRRGELPPDAGVAGSRGLDGDGPLGPAQREVISRGLGPDDAPRERRATRWESRQPDGGRIPPDQHRLDAGDIGEYRGRVRDAVTGNARTGRLRVPGDASLYATADGHSGAFVTRSGRLHLWHKPNTKFADDWDSVLAAASDDATWTVVPDIRSRRGESGIDRLAEHGWRPVARTTDDVVYLVRDPNGWTGSLEIPRRSAGQGGWTSVKSQVPVWSEQQAQATTRAMRQMYLGETRPRFAAEGPPKVRVGDDVVEANPPEITPDPPLNEAVGRKFERLSELDTQIRGLEGTLKHPSRSKRLARLRAERQEIAAGARDAEFGITGKVSVSEFSDDLKKAAKREAPLTAKGGPQTEKVLGIARGMGIDIKVTGWTDSVASYDPFTKKIYLDSKFPFSDDAKAAEILTHEIGHHLYYALPEGSTSRLGSWVPEGEVVEGIGRPAKNREVFRSNTGELSFSDTEAFSDGFARFVRGEALDAETEAFFKSLMPERPLIDAGAPPVNHPGRAYTTVQDAATIKDPDVLTFLWDTDEELARFKPHFDPSVSENLDPAELQKIFALEAEIRRFDPQYTIKLAPQEATPYYSGQGSAYRAAIAGRRMASDNWWFQARDKLQQGLGLLFDPVWARELSQATRQEMYNGFLNAGASQDEVNRYIRAIELEWESNMFLTPRLGVHQYRSAAALPESNLNAIAFGNKPVGKFRGFDKSVLDNLAARGVKPHEIVRASSSRLYRNLAKRFPAADGQGNLGNIADQLYGLKEVSLPGANAALSAARGGSHLVKTGYHIFRFLLDPRWYAMNFFEADILGISKWGMDASRPGGARRVNPVTNKFVNESKAAQIHQHRFGTEFVSVEDILTTDATASGWLDPRKLGGYVGAAFDVHRPETTRDVIMKMLDSGNPIIDDLRAKFGIDPEDWVKGLDDLLYDIDTKGARATVLDEAAALADRKELVWNEIPKNAGDELFNEFLDRLYKGHQKNFEDIMHTFHGNVNRSNLERLLNSPLLWWPISYQLKAGKWLIDVLTDRMLGARTDLMGVWGFDKLMSNHAWQYENDPEYARIWDDHPALWRTASMFLPITPFDMGVFMARWTRYSGSWVGAQLGLWDQDPSYPQDLGNFFLRSTNLGAVFSADILSDIFEEIDKQTSGTIHSSR